ncbi:hypothetical protein GPECTOR_22g859 [Gonium pectorale]|uniref:Protein kinase domain-containing protein n=1 Tax=Gonium pectorale TaxID=33097 RepID=A0A150GHG2_GONPE|nr:hypothetical protein GPECTOR_22g859 [Gonium pectorale]|eukprot:KXZ49266.1 hypothetical protein GPECTOR_22g859 [Gonium pectorale]
MDKARDRRTGEVVALKRVRFDRSRDGVPVTSIRELRVLQACRHPNVVALKKVVTGSQPDSVFLVFEYCEHDLGRLLDSLGPPPVPAGAVAGGGSRGGAGGGRGRGFSMSEVKCLMRQLLEAVAFLHDRWVVHRDIKLSNLLYTHTGHLKLCDFGLARYFAPFVTPMTPNVVTLWYRAPEVLLGSEEYDESIDVWSCGAVLAELLTGEPLFPASSEIECLNMMAALLGSPTERIWPGMSSLPNASKFVFPDQPYCLLRRALPGLSEAGLGLLGAMLTYDPDRRITARQALKHEFFREKPYPKQPADMPTYPSSHDAPRGTGHHHHHHQHGRHLQAQPQQQPGVGGGGGGGVKRTWSEAAAGLLEARRAAAFGGAGGGGGGGGGTDMDARFGAAFGGSGGGGLLEGSGVQLVRQR